MSIPSTYPADVALALEKLLSGLNTLSLPAFALATYGSLARGTFREGESDVNFALILGEGTPATLASLREPTRAAFRAVRAAPFIAVAKELPRIARVFPIKLLSIQQHHHMVSGADPFSTLVIERDDVKRRAEQELTNHILRLRRTWLFEGSEARSLGSALYGSATPLSIELEALLWLRGIDAEAHSMDQIFEAASRAFDLDRETLSELAGLKTGQPIPDIDSLFARVLVVVERAIELLEAPESTP